MSSPKEEAAAARRRRNFGALAGVVALVLLVVALRHRIQFDWTNFFTQLRMVRLGRVFAGIGLVYAGYYCRALRWAIFLKPVKRVSGWTLLGAQFIGFAAIALFGRFADLTRPYLIGRRTQLSFASQVAVYAIERMFDLAAAAVIFSVALALTPRGDAHHHVFVRAGELSLGLTAAIGIFALAAYFTGEAMAGWAPRFLGKIGGLAAEKILAFREGLGAIRSGGDFALAAGLSLLNWAMIGEAYVQCMHAFGQTPELASLTYPQAMLVMAVGIGGSLLQLPVLGWFTQIAFAAGAMHAFYGAPLEAATACGAVLQIVLWISVIPVGAVWARVKQVSLAGATKQSEA